MPAPPRFPVLVVTGPTGAGKSDLAIALAIRMNGVIVNSDSLQLYRGFDIGSAKTPLSERRNIPHFMLDVLDLSQRYSAGEYAREARAVIAEIAVEGRLPIVVGGTGFYLKALFEGLPSLPPQDASLRRNLGGREARRPGRLHHLLKRLDPQSAGRIHPSDLQKTMRALEIRILTGTAMPEPKNASRFAEAVPIFIGLDPEREALIDRLKVRTKRMFEQGLLDEVRGFLANGATGQEKPFEALGYKQALRHVRGEIDREQAIESTFIETRQYAKRQLTWFRRQPDVSWIRAFGDSPTTQEQAIEIYQTRIANLSNDAPTQNAKLVMNDQ